MKKITLITLMLLAAVSVVNSHSFSATPAGAAPQPAGINRFGSVARLPSERVMAPILPPGIQDPLLLEAWTRVYQQQDAIQLWEGVTVSGRGLAQHALESAIPVVWDTDNVCRGGSCSVLYCSGQHCTYEDGQPGVEPIYVGLSERGDVQSLTRTLAHEIFHRTQPFGQVLSTRYEEYWAFRVGASVSQADWPRFGAYDPLDPDHLNLWIRENRLDYYFQLPEYPAAVAAQVHRASGGGDPFAGIPDQAYATPAGR